MTDVDRIVALEAALRDRLTWANPPPAIRTDTASPYLRLRVTVGSRAITCRAASGTETFQVVSGAAAGSLLRAKGILDTARLVSDLLRFGTPTPSAVDLLGAVADGEL